MATAHKAHWERETGVLLKRKPARAAPWCVLAIAGALTASPLRAEDGWRIESGAVRVVCPLTVGGSFEATTRAVSGSATLTSPQPPAFGGEITVDLRTLDTGIGLRNRHMRENYLEVDKGEGFDKAVLTDIRLSQGDAASFQGKTGFTGTLRLHGVVKPVAGQAQVGRAASKILVDAAFPVRLLDYQIEKPQYLGVGVKTEVQVKVSLVAIPASGAIKEGR